jgi:eukaryotic-like serine/threonine-protein kinase
MSIEPNAILAGKYRLESLLGRGGMGSVWRAEHLGLNAPVAVKLLDQVDLHGEALGRFHREARAAAAIRSPHVVQILDHGVDEISGTPFIVMELMDGESLAQRLDRAECLTPAVTANVFTQVARALSRAHEAQIVHRDLKPDNIFLVRNEDEEVAKVLDFGIAKTQQLGADSATRTGAVMGTAYYMSPEQISGAKGVDFRTDLWALGVMACECLTGKRPFDAETIGGLALKICVEPIPAPSTLGTVPTGFDAWFARAVSRDAAQRFSSARELADALRLVCTGDATSRVLLPSPKPSLRTMTEAITDSPLSRSAAPVPSPKSNNRATVALVAALGLLVAGTLLWQRTQPEEAAAPISGASAVATLAGAASALPAVSTEPAVGLRPQAVDATPNPAAVPSVAPSAVSPARQRAPASAAAAPPKTIAAQPPERPAEKAASAAAPARTAAPVGDLIDDRH